MKLKEINKGIWNIFYSCFATCSRNAGLSLVAPRTVWIAATYACNSKCKMCSIWKRYRENPGLYKKEMTFEEFKKFVDNNRFLKDISLSGGEPFLKQEIDKMFLYLDEKGYATGTATNSIMKDAIMKKESFLLEKLSGKNQHALEISIDGLGKEHDRVRGVKGLFEKAVELVKWGIEKQKSSKFFSVNVSHTITSHNYHQLLDFIDFFVNLGLKPEQISFRTAQASESFYGNIKSKELPRENEKIIKEVKKVMEKYPYYKEDWFYRNMLNYLKSPLKFRIPCYAAVSFAYIDPYWNVYPCVTWNKPIGNLRENDFSIKKLWKSEEARKARVLIKAEKCPNCWTGCSTIPSRVSNINLLTSHYLKKILT